METKSCCFIGHRTIKDKETIEKRLITGRNVGLPERVPMVGFPFHVRDKYIDNIRKENAVVVIEPEKELEYLISFKELFAGEVKTDEELEEEQEENEKAAELQSKRYRLEEINDEEDEEEYRERTCKL